MRKVFYLVLEYLINHIFLWPYGARGAVSYVTRLDLVGWATSDGAAHVLSCGYRGSYPHS
jgi:hypothetical protein